MSATRELRTRTRTVGDEPLPGYRLVAPLGKGGFGEVWKCLAPGGLAKAIKFVIDDGDPDSLEQEYDAFQHVKSIRHPFLLTLERVELIGNELLMVMELADKSLANRFDECRAEGMAGIPRHELLRYLVDAAEALDVLSKDHGLQHLDIKPANLFIVSGHVKVGDYGLVAKYFKGAEQDESLLSRGLTPRYVAPEILSGHVDSHSDQYSFALVYQEMLTGKLPYPGPSSRQYLLQHRTAKPDVSALPLSDQETVFRALAKNPSERFPSCLAFIESLLSSESASTRWLKQTSRHIPHRPATAITNSGVITMPVSLVTPTTVSHSQRLKTATTLRQATITPAENDHGHRSFLGYELKSEIERNSYSTLFKGCGENGELVRMKLVRLDGGTISDLEAALRTLSATSHPLVWQTLSAKHTREIGFQSPGASLTLHEWQQERIAKREPPFTPARLVELLKPIAATLDAVQQQCGFPHGLVSAHVILKGESEFGLCDFGISELLRLSRPDTDWLEDEQTAAPELHLGKPHKSSDQFSLALVLLELLGLWQPTAKKQRAEKLQVNWSALRPAELAPLRRALAADPRERFEGCVPFLEALRTETADGIVLPEVFPVESVQLLKTGGQGPSQRPMPDEFAEHLLSYALKNVCDDDAGALPVLLPDGRWSISFPVKWTPGLGELKVAVFNTQFHYRSTPMASDTLLLKPHARVGTVVNPVELVVRWPVLAEAGVAEVQVIGRWMSGLDSQRGKEQVLGMMDVFRKCVGNMEDRRRSARIKVDMPIQLFPVNDELHISPAIRGRCRDISATGFSATFEAPLPNGHAFVWFESVPKLVDFTLLARVVRTSSAVNSPTTTLGWRFVHAPDRA